MKLMRIIIFTLALVIVASLPTFAGMGVGSAGISYDREAGNPGFHLMGGSQFAVDSTGEAWPFPFLKPTSIDGRLLAVKFNYGKNNIDQVNFGFVGYYDYLRPYWDLRLGVHLSGSYAMKDGGVGFMTGGELRKDFIADKFGIFIAGDMLWTPEQPFNLFYVSVGLLLNLM